MSSRIWSAGLSGLEAAVIAVEADSGGGDFGQIKIVGLPDTAVAEARERVRSALRHCGLEFPRRQITVNLAPADLKKRGPAYDLPIAVSILALSNRFRADFDRCLIAGELSLDGGVRPISGVLAMAMAVRATGIKDLFIPAANAAEAKLIEGLRVFPVDSLTQLIGHLKGRVLIKESADDHSSSASALAAATTSSIPKSDNDLSEIRGQDRAKRGLIIAAAGGHNILLSGPPGAGKTMLARALPGILPDLSPAEQLEVTKIHSAAGELRGRPGLITRRPFRAPHHSASAGAILGGGTWPQPGEISLAHRGVLFLDEFPEFSRAVLEGLRQPLEDGSINVGRAAGSQRFPARFILLAAMNPCPCGYRGDRQKLCNCQPAQIARYRARLSGPILDRIDLHLAMPRLELKKLQGDDEPNDNDAPSNDGQDIDSSRARAMVREARSLQARRYRRLTLLNNSELTTAAVRDYCLLDKAGRDLMLRAGEKLNLSARAYFRSLKLARSIADLAGGKDILPAHLAEALQYRPQLE